MPFPVQAGPCKISSVAAAETKTKALEWEEARSVVLREVMKSLTAAAMETVSIEAAYGRVLAKDIQADRDYPALDRSLRDGFAIHADESPGKLRVIGEVRAGGNQSTALPSGQALEIMTGAPVPAGADAVVMVEHVERDGDTVTIPTKAASGQFINRQGAEAQAGAALVAAGTRLDASHIATLAMTGTINVPVFARPSIAILSTGDELVDVNEIRPAHQIRNSNSYSLAALAAGRGWQPSIQPVAGDTEADIDSRAQTRPRTRPASHFRWCFGGQVRPGETVSSKSWAPIFSLSASEYNRASRRRSGKRAAKFVFGLPGNPGSSMVTFQLFARIALELLAGVKSPVCRYSALFSTRRLNTSRG